MNGISLKIDRTQLEKELGIVLHNLDDKHQAMKDIGALGVSSIQLNFHVGGRPKKWAKPKRRDGQPLRDTDRLMNSINARAGKDNVVIGTNDIRAAVLHYGAVKHSFGTFTFTVPAHDRKTAGGKTTRVRRHERTVKLPWGTIPPRNFVLLQDEDLLDAQDILARHIVRGGNQ